MLLSKEFLLKKILIMIILIILAFLINNFSKFEQKENLIIKNVEKSKRYNEGERKNNENIIICNPGFKLINRTCIINYSFEIIYRTYLKNEEVILINKLYEKYIVELFIDNVKIKPTNIFTFNDNNDHNVKILLNSKDLNSTEEMFYNISNLIAFESRELNFNNILNTKRMFKNCINIKKIYFNYGFYESIIDLSDMFENCHSLEDLNLSNLVSKKAENISHMFANCNLLKYFNSNFNTYSVKDMNGLFYGCSSLISIDLSSFETPNLIDIGYMFAECSSLTSINIKFFIATRIKNINYLFHNCVNLEFVELPNLYINKSINKSHIFEGCNSLKSSVNRYYKRNIKEKYDVCIVGLWYGCNYGSMITYYALHQAILKLGFSVLMVDDPLEPPNEIYSRIHPKYITKDMYNISERKELSQLHELNGECQCFLVGSDQLWNIKLSKDLNQFYFLGFVNNDTKKISYGTSFGTYYNGTDSEKTITRNNLNRFFAISVRDELSLNISKKIFNIKNAVQVCDPSFLCDLGDYLNLIKNTKINTEKYILAYVLDTSSEIGHRLERLSKDKNIKVIVILDHPPLYWNNKRRRLNLTGEGNVELKQIVDLKEWLWYFNNSKAVFTDSFHGTIFSIIFKKPFITLKNKKRGGERFISLLKPLNLMHRLFEYPRCINDKYHLLEKIVYHISLKKLRKIINYSYNWLNNTLQKIYD